MSKKKLNIGIFTYDFFPIFGGMGRHVHELYKQNQLYHDVNMLIFSPSSNSLPNHIQIFPETKKSKFKNIEFSIKLNNSFNKFIQQYKLDIVHLQGGPGGFFLFKILNIPVIYTCHHTYWQQSTYIKGQSWKKFFYYLEKLSYKKADKIICVSKDTMDVLSKHYEINRSNLTYIPNGIDFNPSKTLKLITKKLKNILYVGRIDKRKGVDFLVESMKVVNRIDPEVTLFIVGEGKDKVKLEQFSKRNNLSIKFLGYLSDEEINELYKTVILQIVPSIFEGFGISVLEGMSKGVPVIATDVDGIRGIIKNQHTGILIPYGNKLTLAEEIINLLTNYNLQKEIINNANKTLAKYSWKDIYLYTIQIYEKLIK